MPGLTALMIDWAPDSWRRFEARQQPDYPDAGALAAATRELAAYPPLVRLARGRRAARRARRGAGGPRLPAPGRRLRGELRGILAGEHRGDLRPDRGDGGAARRGVGPAGRSGSGGSPASSPSRARRRSEMQGGVALPAYRGDIVNDIALRRRRAPARSGADVPRLCPGGGDAQPYRGAAPERPPSTPATRPCSSPSSRRWSAATRTAAAASPARPISCGSATAPSSPARPMSSSSAASPTRSGSNAGRTWSRTCCCGLLDRLDPRGEPGRITLIGRMGARPGRRQRCRRCSRAVRAAGQPVLWACDPMHGNTLAHRRRHQDPPARRDPRRARALLRGDGGRRASAAAASISR